MTVLQQSSEGWCVLLVLCLDTEELVESNWWKVEVLRTGLSMKLSKPHHMSSHLACVQHPTKCNVWCCNVSPACVER